MRYAFLALALLAVPASAAGAQTATLEIDVLDAYLATGDVAPGLPHCARHSGTVTVRGQGPIALPTGGTNAILVEHTAFHAERGHGPGHVPSTDDSDRTGDIFLGWHEEFIGAYEAWREREGHPPLDAWDPGTPMPPSLDYEFPTRGCVPGRSDDPQAGFPTWATFEGGETPDTIFGHTKLCDFADANQFGKAIAVDWHVGFHQRIGGDSSVGVGPRDPAFWAAHLFLIERTRAFEQVCGDDVAAAEAANGLTPREVPGPTAGILALAGLLALVARRKAS